ncbi:MAG: choice-of-anchor P family protein [Acidimicrobiia bacterium]
MRKHEHSRLRPTLAAPIAALGLLAGTIGPALAERSNVVDKIRGQAKAAAFALDVDVDLLNAVPLDVGPLAQLRLSGDAGPRFENVAKIDLPPLLEALVLATGAETSSGKDLASKASARVATIKLRLLGELLIKLIKSECEVKDNVVNVGSDLVFADGSVLGIGVDAVGLAARPNSRIHIPLVGTLILNEQQIDTSRDGNKGAIEVTVNALRLELDGILGVGDVTVAQSVCKVKGKGVGQDVEIISTVNGADTSAQVDDHDGGLLGGGLLGDGLL